jgi:1,4-dihydroxy-6-naphthoate synthase
MNIKLGFSTCPNDTFMFDAMVHQRIDVGPYTFEVHLSDIFHLNQMAIAGALDMVKISYHTLGQVQDRYHLLDAGSALGHDCGPLLISRHPITPQQLAAGDLRVAIPGANTTANLLLGFFAPQLTHKVEHIFHEIMPALEQGEVDLGVIIHENRFTYQQHGLHLVQDLGAYWEQQTNLPIPLGAIVARHRLGEAVIADLERLMRSSVAFAFAQPEASRAYVRAHAQEMDPAVMQAHIDLYVNQYSLGLGQQGRAAVDRLLQTGEQLGLYAQT